MKSQNLADFLREKTGKELVGQGDGLEDYKTDIHISECSKSDANKVRESIADFYKQNGYEPSESNDPSDFSIIFEKDRSSKAIAFSYFGDTETVMITAVTIGKGGISS